MDIVVDIDGTLANIEHRLHFIREQRDETNPFASRSKFKPNWDAFFEACDKDAPIGPTCALVKQLIGDDEYSTGNNIIFVTGRPMRTYMKTINWLKWNVSYCVGLCPVYMRKDGDHRPDDVVKREILSQIRNEGFNPKLAIDDRSRVVKMWREEGLICMQVAEGEY